MMQRLSQHLPVASVSGVRNAAALCRGVAATGRRRLQAMGLPRFIAGTEVLLTIALAVIGARLVWTAFEPPAWAAADGGIAAAVRTSQATVSPLSHAIDPFHRAPATGAVGATSAQAPETMLDLELFGIRAGRSAGEGSAIVATPDKEQGVFAVGQEIMPGVRLEQVLPDRIVIRRNGVSESLSFARDGQTLQAVVTPAVTPLMQDSDEASVRRVSLNAADLAGLLRVVPHERNGVRGLLLESSADPSLLQQAGLAPGDLLISINGTAVTDAGALASLGALAVPGASDTARLSLEIEREGQRKFHRLAIDRTQ